MVSHAQRRDSLNVKTGSVSAGTSGRVFSNTIDGMKEPEKAPLHEDVDDEEAGGMDD